METVRAIEKRASIREYQDKPIDKESFEKLVDAGRRAPTARHEEPWEFVVVTQKDILKKFGQMAPNGSFLSNAPGCIVIFCRDSKYYLEDGCAATENILLTAADLGLGACWVAGDKKDYALEVARMLNVPSGYKLISLISLGWPASEINQVRNRGLDEVLHWERF